MRVNQSGRLFYRFDLKVQSYLYFEADSNAQNNSK